MEVDKIKANGPWVLVDPEEPPKRTNSGLYLPDGNAIERLGHVVARVKSAGEGYWETKQNGKLVFIKTTVGPGDRVVFRGHLREHNRVGNTKHCFMHAKDLVLVLDNDVELSLALPYDN